MHKNEKEIPGHGPAALVEALLKTLEEEHEALEQLSEQFRRQLDAIRQQQLDLHDEAMQGANDAVGTLARLRSVRERQMRLLGRVLKVDVEHASLQELADALDRQTDHADHARRLLDMRRRVREKALQTRQVCERLNFTLQYAVSLGRELLKAVQALDVPPPARVYTASGSATQAATPRSFVNQVG